MNDVKQNNIPIFNAEIGKLLDEKAVDLKRKNTNYTRAYIALLFLGAGFADIHLQATQQPLSALPVVWRIIDLK